MRWFIYLVIVFVFLACHSGIKRPMPPDDLISEEIFIATTKDLMLIEGHINLTYKQMNTFYKIMDSSANAVYKKNGLTKNQYTRSFEYYASDQNQMTLIYSKVLDELTLEKAKVKE